MLKEYRALVILRTIIGALLISFLVRDYYNKIEIATVLNNLVDEEIDEILIEINFSESRRSKVTNKASIELFESMIKNCTWKLDYSNKVQSGKKASVPYTFVCSNETLGYRFTLHGTDRLVIIPFDKKSGNQQLYELKVSWAEGTYEKIINFANSKVHQ